MAKIKNPFFAFRARGTIGDQLTIRNQKGTSIAEATPHPTDPATAEQLSWRTMYQACSQLWHDLSPAEKQTWNSLANSRHMTGFALWQSQCLRPNPGIYLPLAGGTMSGNIDMDSHSITNLPTPTLDGHAASKKYVDDNAAPPDYPKRLKPNITRWHTPGWYAAYYVTATLTAGRIYYIPIFVDQTTDYDQWGFYTASSVVGSSTLYLYEWNDGVPGDLIQDLGDEPTNPGGNHALAITLQLTRGYYFLGFRADNASGLSAPNPTYAIAPPVEGVHTAQQNAQAYVIPYVDAALADPAPAPTGVLTGNYCVVCLRDA